MMVIILKCCVSHVRKKHVIKDITNNITSLDEIVPFANKGLNVMIIDVWYMNIANV